MSYNTLFDSTQARRRQKRKYDWYATNFIGVDKQNLRVIHTIQSKFISSNQFLQITGNGRIDSRGAMKFLLHSMSVDEYLRTHVANQLDNFVQERSFLSTRIHKLNELSHPLSSSAEQSQLYCYREQQIDSVNYMELLRIKLYRKLDQNK